MRSSLAVALAVAASVAVPSTRADSPPPRPAIVHVDIIASDARGRVVSNLKPSDFEITENGVAQQIESLRFVNAPAVAAGEPLEPIRSEFDEQQQASREGTRLFALLLDEYHVKAADSERVRAALTEFVDKELGPGDLVAVLKPLDSLLTIRATRDRDLIRHAVETFEGRMGDYEPRSAFERNYIAGAPGRIEQMRAQISISALNALVIHIGKLNDGRKTVLVVSEGLGRARRRRGLEGLPTVDSVIRAASRYNVAIYPIDPSEDAADADESGQTMADLDVMAALADGTNGRSETKPGALDAALQQMVRDASSYYLLSYHSLHDDDGKFREVQVRVKRPNVTLRARKGYWALWPDEALASELLARATAPPRPIPPALLIPLRTSPLIRPWFGLSRGDGGKTRVTFVWEPAPRVPGDRLRPASPSRVVLTAFGADGEQLFTGTVTAAGGAGLDAPDESAARAVFDVPPGRLRLRMSIEGAAAQVIDSDVREIAIRDLKGPVALGTAEMLRTRTMKDFRVTAADPLAVPVASREFSRTERIIVRFPAYAADGAPQVSVRLMNRIGQVLRELVVTPPQNRDGLYQVDLPLASFAPAEYLLEIAATSSTGEAKDLVGFRVTH